jgi:glutathione S-transferase
MTITLFHAPRSRSFNALWLLEELGQPYDIKLVDIRRGDGSGGLDADNPHPHGKVPVIRHDGVLVHEQVAIAQYLADLFPSAGLAPAIGSAERGPFLTWLAYYSGVIEPAFLSKFLNTPVPRGTAGWVVVEEAMAHVNRALERSDYLAGSSFTAADIPYAGAFKTFWESPLFEKTAALEGYVERCISRPAYARAAEKDSGA